MTTILNNPHPILTAFWLALVVGWVLRRPALNMLIRLKSRQTISAYVPEHQAKQGTPTMGGLLILAGVFAALAYELATPADTSPREIAGYLLVMGLFGAIGFVDDYLVPRLMVGKRGLGWKQKIILELVLASGPIAWMLHGDLPSTALAVISVLFFANAYNFLDGLDGLAGTVGALLLTGFALLAATQAGDAARAIPMVCVAIIGALVPFLSLNAPPAKMFMGDVGSLPIGAALGFMFWRLAVPGNGVPSEGLAATAMSVIMTAELLPVPIQIASVKLRNKRVFRKTPIHHGFQDQGIPETRIVAAFALFQFVLVALGISLQLLLHPVIQSVVMNAP